MKDSINEELTTKDKDCMVNSDLEEGELPDDETDSEKEDKEDGGSEIVDPPPPPPAAIPSLLDMKISPPPNGKTFFTTHHGVNVINVISARVPCCCFYSRVIRHRHTIFIFCFSLFSDVGRSKLCLLF